MKFLGYSCYAFAALGTLVAFANIMEEMQQLGSGPNVMSGFIGFIVGSLLIPLLFFLIGERCMKKARAADD